MIKKLKINDSAKAVLKKIAKILLCFICILLAVALLTVSVLGIYSHSTKGDASLLEGDTQKAFATEYKNVACYPKTKTQGRYWRDGMVGGNGRLGFVTSGAPYSDTIIYQDVDYIMPTDRDRYDMPDLTGDLEGVRQAVVNCDDEHTYSECGPWNYGYAFHPGQQLRLTQDRTLFYKNYIRWTDYETGEVGVKYTDKNGDWERKTFTSRTDDVTVTSIQKSSSDGKINLTLSLDDLGGMYKYGQGDESHIQYKKIVPDDCSSITMVAHYPDYELSSLSKGGYAGVTYVVTVGGTKEKISLDKYSKEEEINVGEQNPAIKITDADEVYLITKNDRDFEMGDFDDFKSADSYALTDSLLADCKAVVDKYSNDGGFDYYAALAPSAALQADMFNRVSFSLGNADNKQRYLSNEELLSKQRLSKDVNEALLERIYKQARYTMIISSGYSMTRLSGMWTGEWMPGWRSEYTMDANVNLQSSGMNTANVEEFGEGYIKFILRQIDDWKTNAEKCYGMKDAIMAPVNCDGDGALNAEYAMSYPFQYWNAGASWMLQPVFEYYQCYGNTTVVDDNGNELRLLEDVLLPLLTLQSNFWDQLVTPEYYTDSQGNACYEKGKTQLNPGEKYLIVPSYSPENTTGGKDYNSTLGANAAIDIAAAKSGLEMTIQVESLTKTEGYEKRVAHWQSLLSLLPDYQFDDTGAIKEWCANQYVDNNKHRHISHLYCAWPLTETQDDEELEKAALQAVENREKENSASHGLVHQALVYARLKQGNQVNDIIHSLLKSRICYQSLMTDHNTNRGSDTYCTDTELGLVGIVNETLLYSNSGVIDALTSLPNDWEKGEIKGLVARTQAEVSISWEKSKATVTVTSKIDQKITVSCKGKDAQEADFKAGETKTFEFNY